MTTLYTIKECAQVFVDALVRNEASQLMLMSVFGRDTAIRELMARMQISGPERLDRMTIEGDLPEGKFSQTVWVNSAKELDKVTGRLPRTLYGQIVHAWIFHKSITEPEKSAKRAWILDHFSPERPPDAQALRERIWQSVCDLSDIPLLAHWRDVVLDHIERDMVFEMGKNNPPSSTVKPEFCKPIGALQAVQVCLSDDFNQRVCDLIREGRIGLEQSA